MIIFGRIALKIIGLKLTISLVFGSILMPFAFADSDYTPTPSLNRVDVNGILNNPNLIAIVDLDKKEYTWTDKVYITVASPDHNTNSNQVDEIGTSDQNTVKISTSKYSIENYKLVETGIDTSIFTGEIILTGFSHDADGNEASGNEGNDIVLTDPSGTGPIDGLLPSSNVDTLTVSFEVSEDETVVGSASIRWNEGKVQWTEPNYPASGTGIVRVIEPDMNLDPEDEDNFVIDVWSDSDSGGINLMVTETGKATGIFEGTVFFSTDDESSGHRLRVSGEDMITAEYEDNTLPEPYDIEDEKDIYDTAMIQKIPPPSPLKQLMKGISTQEIVCKENFEKIFRPSGMVACVDSSSVDVLVQRGWSVTLIPADFAGKWKNKDSGTNDIANLAITQDNPLVRVHATASCSPEFCDWGQATGTVNGNQVMLSWNLGSISHDIVLIKIGNQIQVERTSHNLVPEWTQEKTMTFIPGTLVKD